MWLPNRRQLIPLSLCVCVLAVILSTSLLLLKREALQFHTRDYNYFVEQAARLTDPNLAKSFALNIEGYNLLGLQGLEGVKSLYHAIHAEYFRYTYALLYGIFRDTLPIYIFYSLIFFLPIVYLAVLPHADRRAHFWLWLIFSALYLLYPATLNAVTSDLRPRMLFAAAWSLAVLAVVYRRPFLEKLAGIGLLLAIREEGILLGGFVIALNFVLMKGRPGRRLQTLLFLGLETAAAAAFLAFMAWGGYTRVDSAYNPLGFVWTFLSNPLLLALSILLLGAVLLGFYGYKKRAGMDAALLLTIYLGAAALTGAQWLRDTARAFLSLTEANAGLWQYVLAAFTNETTSLVAYISILGLALGWSFSRGRARRILSGLVAGLAVLFALITAAYMPGQVAQWRQNLAPARLVWDFTAGHDRYQTKVLLDYATYQAFYNFDQVIVYNRLPVWDTLPEKRYYPQNKAAVAVQIQKGIAYAVIGRESLANVQELASLAGVRATELEANERYVILQFQPAGLTP